MGPLLAWAIAVLSNNVEFPPSYLAAPVTSEQLLIDWRLGAKCTGAPILDPALCSPVDPWIGY